MNSPDDHAAHSSNGHDPRAETDALHIPADAYQEQVKRKEALDDVRRAVSRIRDTVEADLVDALDRLVMMLDVGDPPERDAPRLHWIRWDGPVSLAEEQASTTRRTLARVMRSLADELDPGTEDSSE
jgi:hypothetical protein